MSWVHVTGIFGAAAPHDPSFAPARIEAAVREALRELGPATLHCHRFEPQGLSVVLLTAASRLFLHTWPERGVASFDLHLESETLAAPALRALTRHLTWHCLQTDLRLRDGGDRLLFPGKTGTG